MEGQSSEKIKQGEEKRRGNARTSLLVVFGSALFWSWGFLCYLSPVMFPAHISPEASIGIEYGFFASQAGVVLFALVVLAVARWRQLVVGKHTVFVAACGMALSAVVLFWALSISSLELIIACGLVDGVCVPLVGIAWGARYSLVSKNIAPLVTLSFLVAYLIYFVVTALPQPLALVLVCVIPLVSWAIWRYDARARHKTSLEVFATKSTDGNIIMPGELLAGIWEAKILPWRILGVLLAASFIGNLVTSVVLGQGYAGVNVIYNGGVIVCAALATMTFVFLVQGKNAFSVRAVYRITVGFTVVGLVGILVFGTQGVAVGGAFVQGSAMFFQVLVILVTTQSTQRFGISPLLSFSVGKGTIAGVVFVSNVLGKILDSFFAVDQFFLGLICGCGLLVLFFMLAAQSTAKSFIEDERFKGEPSDIDLLQQKAPSATQLAFAELEAEELWMQKIGDIASAYHLTRREEEILGYLAKGRSLPYIADTLFVTTGTVKTHTTSIYRKLDINSRQELLDLVEGFEGASVAANMFQG